MSSIFENPNFWAIVGTVIGILSLYYTIRAFTQKANVALDVTSRYKNLADKFLDLEFTNGYSQNILLDISIYNKGSKTAKSIHLGLIFNSEVKIIDLPTNNPPWKESNTFQHLRSFHYTNDSKLHPPNTSFSIGKFEISIPPINQVDTGYYFIANGVLEGDFKPSCFLLLYDLKNDKLILKSFIGKKINYGNNDWNLMIKEKSQPK